MSSTRAQSEVLEQFVLPSLIAIWAVGELGAVPVTQMHRFATAQSDGTSEAQRLLAVDAPVQAG